MISVENLNYDIEYLKILYSNVYFKDSTTDQTFYFDNRVPQGSCLIQYLQKDLLIVIQNYEVFNLLLTLPQLFSIRKILENGIFCFNHIQVVIL
ncbi:unnamed protein product (macronuclear) [Paramecium tetraurelia]|uniref:CYTH domain-containing protein n=1 Tax=Paramecium tetraurelia TaxID=5888 RepID=A0CUV0_PARTE|nr:uncharacterized protein GSPATT00039022001 [Paramecium tetraurelia]CAK74567.1 unnamed protein product [Paramecium tetraurelia]|eukprot:XP_001441964.1 hypothetical protein (macronuclear) [Paramecium tetraurelia strain d4-2]